MNNKIERPKNEEVIVGIRNLTEGLWTTPHDVEQGEVYLFLVSVQGVDLHCGGRASGVMRLSEMHAWSVPSDEFENSTFTRFRGNITLCNNKS